MANYLGPVIGFVMAWVLFELTEFRRRWVRASNVRRSFVAEMKSVERVLSATVFNLSMALGEPDRVVTEMRWLIGQKEALDMLGEAPPGLLEKSDQEIADILKMFQSKASKDVPELPVPILSAVLSTQGFGFTSEEIQILCEANRYIHGLGHHARSMRENVRLTFTVIDETNRAIVQDNYLKNLHSCRLCAVDGLSYVRKAIKTVTPSPPVPSILRRFYLLVYRQFGLWMSRARELIK